MEKKILLAVDNSVHSRQAIDYAVRMSSVAQNLEYTLFHVQPPISQFLLDEAEIDFKARAKLKRLVKENARKAQRFLEEHKDHMVRLGVSENAIDTVTEPKIQGLARDIIERAQQKLYDAVVVGRRGLSRAQKMFMGHVTTNLLEHCTVIPVWVVDGEVTATKIMAAVDGSESSLRAVDHLSFMVGQNPEVKLTLFHVIPRVADYCVIDFKDQKEDIEEIIAKGDRRCIEHFYAHVRKKFSEAGIQEDQIEIKTTRRTVNVGKAITQEAKKGEYGTVVIGRRGVSKAFFLGSVSKYVIDKISNRAFWLVS